MAKLSHMRRTLTTYLLTLYGTINTVEILILRITRQSHCNHAPSCVSDHLEVAHRSREGEHLRVGGRHLLLCRWTDNAHVSLRLQQFVTESPPRKSITRYFRRLPKAHLSQNVERGSREFVWKWYEVVR